MPYITSAERIGSERGHREGRQEAAQITRDGIYTVQAVRFGEVPSSIVESLNAIADIQRLQAVNLQAVNLQDANLQDATASSLEAFIVELDKVTAG